MHEFLSNCGNLSDNIFCKDLHDIQLSQDNQKLQNFKITCHRNLIKHKQETIANDIQSDESSYGYPQTVLCLFKLGFKIVYSSKMQEYQAKGNYSNYKVDKIINQHHIAYVKLDSQKQ